MREGVKTMPAPALEQENSSSRVKSKTSGAESPLMQKGSGFAGGKTKKTKKVRLLLVWLARLAFYHLEWSQVPFRSCLWRINAFYESLKFKTTYPMNNVVSLPPLCDRWCLQLLPSTRPNTLLVEWWERTEQPSRLFNPMPQIPNFWLGPGHPE